jgi:hypothetical protein
MPPRAGRAEFDGRFRSVAVRVLRRVSGRSGEAVAGQGRMAISGSPSLAPPGSRGLARRRSRGQILAVGKPAETDAAGRKPANWDITHNRRNPGRQYVPAYFPQRFTFVTFRA